MQQILLATRASHELTERVDRLATLEKRSRSQVLRLLLEDAIEKKEQEMGLSVVSEGNRSAGHEG